MDYIKELSKEFNWGNKYIENIVNLLDEGNTIPFIARYRKEATGSMDETILREVEARLKY
ncbi:MAG: Tex-like N-terminal domain-containing protein, partial [Eubacteriales bacterium]|nr:Tex-like N-terminal domain-containing protein [Eubacteriales bacterium]